LASADRSPHLHSSSNHALKHLLINRKHCLLCIRIPIRLHLAFSKAWTITSVCMLILEISIHHSPLQRILTPPSSRPRLSRVSRREVLSHHRALFKPVDVQHCYNLFTILSVILPVRHLRLFVNPHSIPYVRDACHIPSFYLPAFKTSFTFRTRTIRQYPPAQSVIPSNCFPSIYLFVCSLAPSYIPLFWRHPPLLILQSTNAWHISTSRFYFVAPPFRVMIVLIVLLIPGFYLSPLACFSDVLFDHRILPHRLLHLQCIPPSSSFVCYTLRHKAANWT